MIQILSIKPLVFNNFTPFRNLNTKRLVYFKKKKKNYFKKGLLNKLIRFKYQYRFTSNIFNRKYLFLNKFFLKFTLQLYIRVNVNNIFCTLRNIHTNKILLNSSFGLLKLDTSKKKLNYNIKFLLENFLIQASSYLNLRKNLIVQIISAKKFRKKILNILKQKIKKKNLILRTKKNKCFNGCRPSKKRRKKRVVLRISI